MYLISTIALHYLTPPKRFNFYVFWNKAGTILTILYFPGRNLNSREISLLNRNFRETETLLTVIRQFDTAEILTNTRKGYFDHFLTISRTLMTYHAFFLISRHFERDLFTSLQKRRTMLKF